MSGHSDFIRTSRALAHITNESPNQIRVAMRRFIKQQTAAQAQAAKDENGTVPVSRNLPPADGAMSTSPRPFTPPDNSRAGAGAPPSGAGGDKQVIINDNGTLNYYIIPATFVSAV